MSALSQKLTETLDEYRMLEGARGVTVALSGGADSVALLLAMKKLGGIELRALHINHNLRESAKRDEDFCRDFCKREGISLEVYSENVADIAKTEKLGTEEAARNIRYRIFAENSRGDFPVALAHNADDNLETVVFNLCRGASARGLAGIPPARDRIIRPLISVSREEILEFLNEENASFVTDETNFDTKYTRNFIRHKILPLMKEINPSVTAAATSSSFLLRRDESFLEREAQNAVEKCSADLAELDDAILSRVIQLLFREKTGKSLPARHTAEVMRLLRRGGRARVSLPGGCFAEISDRLSIHSDENKRGDEPFPEIFEGENYFTRNGRKIMVYMGKRPPSDESDKNVYNLSITEGVKFDRIYGKVFIRERQPGDTVRSAGMTKKLKKLFCDRLTPSAREVTPVFCDEKGVLLIPGVCVRDDAKLRSGKDEPYYISLFAQI